MDQKGLAAKVREFRKKLGLTQRQLATQAGVSGPYLAQIETGDRFPGLDTLITICQALDLQESERDDLITLYGIDQKERVQHRAKNREKALREVVVLAKDLASRPSQEGTGDQIGTLPRHSNPTGRKARPMSNDPEQLGDPAATIQYSITTEVDQIRENLSRWGQDVLDKGERFPSVCVVGLGRCGTNIALKVSKLAHEAKRAFLKATSEAAAKGQPEADTIGDRREAHAPRGNLPRRIWYQFEKWNPRARKGPIYFVPIVLVGDLNADIRGRINAEYDGILNDAHYKKLKVLNLSEVTLGGAGNVPLIGQYLAKIVLNRDPSSFANAPDWKPLYSYLIDSAGFKKNATRIFFYVFSAGGGTGSGMSGEFGLAQQYSYHRRIREDSSVEDEVGAESESPSPGVETIFSAGIAILPQLVFDGGNDSTAHAIHVNAGRLICKYLAEERRFSKINSPVEKNSLKNILRPWNALMLISNDIMRDYEASEEGQNVNVPAMEERTNRYVSQQIFNILTAQAMTTDYGEKYLRSVGLNIADTLRFDPTDLFSSLVGPVAIAYAESKGDNSFRLTDLLIRSIGLPCLNKQTQAIEGISILPQTRETYIETLKEFSEGGGARKNNYEALRRVKVFYNCPATVTIISTPRGSQLRNKDVSELKEALDQIFPRTKLKRLALVEGASPYVSLTTLISRSACLSDEVLTLFFAYIKRCFADDSCKYSREPIVETKLVKYLTSLEPDESRLRKILKETEDPSEIMLANWEEVKATCERRYRDFLKDHEKFVPMDDIRLKVNDVIDALNYISETLRYNSVSLTSTNVTAWELES